ncbi:MAG: rod shape-determining protein, partial [Candidatus Omnitrophica bacterium]|nr:rod shape-determining protein [Candidatus Omnitrophota bacterium]
SAAVAKVKGKRLGRIFFETLISKAIKKGVVVDAVALVDVVGRVLKNLAAKSNIRIRYVYASLSGQDILTKHSRAIIPLAERGNKVITISDIHRVNHEARILGLSLEEEIIEEIALNYTIDSGENILNPLGLYSHRLGVELYLICAKVSLVEAISRVLHQAGYEVKNLFFSGLATSRIVFNKEMNVGTNIFCDIGSDITEILILENGRLKELEILPLGGDNLTQALADNLRISFDLAEEIKRTYGLVGDENQIKEDKEILIKKTDLYKPIKQKLVCAVFTAAAKSLCEKIKMALEKKIELTKVNNFITAGRTIQLEGFLEMLENTLGISVKIGRILESEFAALVNSDDLLSGHKYLSYLTSLGIISKVLGTDPLISQVVTLPKNPFLKAIHRIKEVYQEYF